MSKLSIVFFVLLLSFFGCSDNSIGPNSSIDSLDSEIYKPIAESYVLTVSPSKSIINIGDCLYFQGKVTLT